MKFVVVRIRHLCLLTELGWDWILFRLYLKFRHLLRLDMVMMPVNDWCFPDMKSGLCAQRPEERLFDVNLLICGNKEQYRRSFGGVSQEVKKRADDWLSGYWTLFSCSKCKADFPPDWHVDPLGMSRFPKAVHWSRIDDFKFGDVKLVWELSRFSPVFDLVRAYWLTGDERYAKGFWCLLEDWLSNNPPNRGVNWKCGQEVAFRVMTLAFGLHGFKDSPETSLGRMVAMRQLMKVSARRIQGHIRYARSQKNNHWISEAVGLWTCGILVEKDRESQGWVREGRRHIRESVLETFLEDGSFSQHSMNYHRLALHDLLWFVAVARAVGEEVDQEVRQRLQKANEWLLAMIMGEDGKVPNYGPNDGAHLFQLTSCGFEDYRPIVQAMAYVLDQDLPFEEGPWDELAFWIGGMVELTRLPEKRVKVRNHFSAPSGGYFVMGSAESSALIRCPRSFKHRMAHADLLHLDLWWRGLNVAIDPGTFSYNAQEPWNNGLSGTRMHNTACVVGRDQAERVSRFLYLPAPKGSSAAPISSTGKLIDYWQGEHDGYQRSKKGGMVHQRGVVRLGSVTWIVCDRLKGKVEQEWEINWLFPDFRYETHSSSGGGLGLTIKTDRGNYHVGFPTLVEGNSLDIVRADPGSTRGWRSRFYSSREPALAVRVPLKVSETCIVTILSPMELVSSFVNDELRLDGCQFAGVVNFSGASSTSEEPIVTAQVREKETEDWLEVGSDAMRRFR